MTNFITKVKMKLESVSIESIHSIYPSPEWNTYSWSYCLLKDLILWDDFCDAFERNAKESFCFIKKYFLKTIVFKDRCSYHGDTSRKVYLYKKLLENKYFDKVVIPEVGPCGFDLAVCMMAGYREFLVFDVNPEYLEFCKNIWGTENIQYLVMDSKGMESIPNLEQYDIILPDWGHNQDFATKAKSRGLRTIEYVEKGRSNRYWRQLKVADFFKFFKQLKTLKILEE